MFQKKTWSGKRALLAKNRNRSRFEKENSSACSSSITIKTLENCFARVRTDFGKLVQIRKKLATSPSEMFRNSYRAHTAHCTHSNAVVTLCGTRAWQRDALKKKKRRARAAAVNWSRELRAAVIYAKVSTTQLSGRVCRRQRPVAARISIFMSEEIYIP